jgi:NADH:ubiquinone oxidoreductase subunit 3 (subunit A)
VFQCANQRVCPSVLHFDVQFLVLPLLFVCHVIIIVQFLCLSNFFS